MKTYRVIFTQTEKTYIEVEAHNKVEALEKANAEWDSGNDGEYISDEVDTETLEVK